MVCIHLLGLPQYWQQVGIEITNESSTESNIAEPDTLQRIQVTWRRKGCESNNWQKECEKNETHLTTLMVDRSIFRTKARREMRLLGSKKSSNETARSTATWTTGAVRISTGDDPFISCTNWKSECISCHNISIYTATAWGFLLL